jgi:hypothetical protein
VSVVAVLLGVLLLGVLVLDVFRTVFVPRGHAGPVTRRVYRWTWDCAHRLSRRSTRPRHRLAHVGPLLLPLTIVLWALELVLAFGLVYVALSDRFVVPTRSGELDSFSTALYVSGYSATTLGVGDVYAGDALTRLLMVVEAALGFALFTVAVTYLLSIYNALQRSTALAAEIASYLGEEEWGAGEGRTQTCALLAGDELVAWLPGVASRISETTQAQEQYALLSYFHVPDDHRALPVALGRLLEVLTVCRTLLDPQRFALQATGQTVVFASHTAVHHAVLRAQVVGGDPPDEDDLRADRGEAYARARAALQAAHVPLRPDAEARVRYDAARAEWDGADLALQTHFGYRFVRR